MSVHWPDLDADTGVEGLLLGARELPIYTEKAARRARRRNTQRRRAA